MSAYLRAALVATAMVLGAGFLYGFLTDGPSSLADSAFLAPFVALYSFTIILVLGAIGHLLLRSTGRAHRTEYLVAGAAWGAAIAWFFFRGVNDRVWFVGALILFIAAGAAAAGVFWRAYASSGA
jgi:hypothetical protein